MELGTGLCLQLFEISVVISRNFVFVLLRNGLKDKDAYSPLPLLILGADESFEGLKCRLA